MWRGVVAHDWLCDVLRLLSSRLLAPVRHHALAAAPILALPPHRALGHPPRLEQQLAEQRSLRGRLPAILRGALVVRHPRGFPSRIGSVKFAITSEGPDVNPRGSRRGSRWSSALRRNRRPPCPALRTSRTAS